MKLDPDEREEAAMAEHTRGPWYWRKTTLPECQSVKGLEWYMRSFRLGNHGGGRVGVVDTISEADAALLAAAPDLLAACEAVVEAHIDGDPDALEAAFGMADVARLKAKDVARLEALRTTNP